VAFADSKVNIQGVTDAWVEATAKVTPTTISMKKSEKVTGTSIVTCHYRLLGIPLPNKCFWTNSFPSMMAQPVLQSAKGSVDSTKYTKSVNKYLGQTRWQITGSQSFAGDITSTIVGKAAGKEAKKGYFYAGHDNCTGTCVKDHAIVLVTVKA
jgi:hypothetical protein